MSVDDYKTCKRCLEFKHRDEFYRRSGRAAQYGDGLMGNCKDCHNAMVSSRIHERLISGDERLKEVQRRAYSRWYANPDNKTKKAEYKHNWYQANRAQVIEREVARRRQRSQSDPEYRAQLAEYKRRRYHSDPEYRERVLRQRREQRKKAKRQ